MSRIANDRQRIERARRVAVMVRQLAEELDAVEAGTTIMGRIRDAQNGPQAQRFDTQRSGPSVPDPTYAAAVRGPDLASRDLVRLDRLLVGLERSVVQLLDLVDRYPAPRPANDADRLALARSNDRGDDGCQNCARIEGERGGPRWSPTHPKLAGPTDVGGRLSTPLSLCRWCYDAVVAWGRLPSETELQRHHRGEVVRWPPDVERPA